MAKQAQYVWMDGKVVPWNEAVVHVSTECALRGENVFEGERGYWNAERDQMYIFRHGDHVRRLRESAKIMRMSIPYTDDEILTACKDLIKACGYRETIHFRPVVYFGEGGLSAFRPEDIRTDMFILAFSQPSVPGIAKGIRSCVSSWQRISDPSTPPRVKAGSNYHNARLAIVEARLNGYDLPVLLNSRGKVSESPLSCIMIVRNGKLITPPTYSDILESITRDTIIDIARNELGIDVIEREIDRSELYIADEAFFCGSSAEVLPIISIDHYDLGSGQVGEVTKNIQSLYFDIAHGRVANYEPWITPVY